MRAAALVAFLAAAVPTAALAADNTDNAVATLRKGPGVYADPAAIGHPLSRHDVGTVRKAVRAANNPFYVAVLGEPHHEQAQADLRVLVYGVGQDGTYVVVGTGGFVAASDVPGIEGQTADLVSEAINAHRNQATAAITEFINLADTAANDNAAGEEGGTPNGSFPDAGTGSGDDNGTSPFVPVLVVGGLFLVAAVGISAFRRSRTSSWTAAQLAEVRQAAYEDVTKLGEELTALDVPPASTPGATDDYQAALDAYERAKAALEQVARPGDLSAVTVPLEEGRWRLACVRARLAGQPLPERRPPCFFNPQHGPSTTDAQWTPPGGVVRTVPVCAADADRLARGLGPDSRLVNANGQSMPYWNAPRYYGPYAGGFFGGWGGSSFVSGLLLGQIMSGGMGWGAYDAGYAAGVGQAGGPDDFAGQFDTGGGGWGGDGGHDFAGGFDTGGGSWGGGGFDSGGGGFDSGGGDFGGGGNGGGW
jgi:uncharacterized membrane protein YgcG